MFYRFTNLGAIWSFQALVLTFLLELKLLFMNALPHMFLIKGPILFK